MNNFPEIQACKRSLSKRRPVFGVGVNDAPYMISSIVNGKKIGCPFYQRWSGMLTRCYSREYQARKPTYQGCYVCKEWLTFSSFKSWMEKQDWQGKHLDKDLLTQGNKIYSPKTCLFIPVGINTLLVNRINKRGGCKLGVTFDKRRKKFQSHCNNRKGRSIHLGWYDDESAAHAVYKSFKYKVIRSIAESQPEIIKNALLRYQISEY